MHIRPSDILRPPRGGVWDEVGVGNSFGGLAYAAAAAARTFWLLCMDWVLFFLSYLNKRTTRLLSLPPHPSTPPFPLVLQGTTNFALFSSNATGVVLCLFTEADLVAGRVTYQVPLHPSANRTGDVWHVAIPDLDPTLLYGYIVEGARADGHTATAGQAFDPVSCWSTVAVVRDSGWRLGREKTPPISHTHSLPCLAVVRGAGPVRAVHCQRAPRVWRDGACPGL